MNIVGIFNHNYIYIYIFQIHNQHHYCYLRKYKRPSLLEINKYNMIIVLMNWISEPKNEVSEWRWECLWGVRVPRTGLRDPWANQGIAALAHLQLSTTDTYRSTMTQTGGSETSWTRGQREVAMAWRRRYSWGPPAGAEGAWVLNRLWSSWSHGTDWFMSCCFAPVTCAEVPTLHNQKQRLNMYSPTIT